jgi:cell division protein FtsI (penicillin-binding protein 3)
MRKRGGVETLRDFNDGARSVKRRLLFLGGLFALLLVAVLGRALQLQVKMREKLRGLAEEQYVRALEIPAKRGDIYDRHGGPLAQSVEVDSIWVDPSLLENERDAARVLSKRLHVDFDELYGRLTKAKRFAWVKRRVSDAEVKTAKALNLPGLGFTKEPERFYPQRELAGQVLGVVGVDGKGLEGLELAFDDELTGETAELDGLRDAKGRKLLVQGEQAPGDVVGAALTLTLDRQLQYLAEKSLAKAVEDAKALSGMAVVMDPKTGELLALAQYPRFNPNAPKGASPFALRDRAALDAFEPGSTFKAFVVAAALEEKAIKPDQSLYCENGSWAIGKRVIHDTHKNGYLTPEQILEVSSNICAAKVAQALGRERLVDYYARFGFGEKTGLAMPGEAHGSVPFPKADIQFATQAFGQGLTATAVQLTAAYGALANGGMLMKPYLVSKVVDPDGVTLLENHPTPVRQVVSAATSRQVVHMLESVITGKEGTAPRARMNGYRVAGKTGTAQKVDPIAHGYSDKRIGSFIGMVPAEDPRLVALVVIDEPKTDPYGGLVAAPAFKEIAEGALSYMGVPPSSDRPLVVAEGDPASKTKKNTFSRPFQVNEETPPVAVTDGVKEGSVLVPLLTGRVGRDAVAKVLAAALEPRLLGSGRVVSQEPSAGTVVPKGTRVTLELATRGKETP